MISYNSKAVFVLNDYTAEDLANELGIEQDVIEGLDGKNCIVKQEEQIDYYTLEFPNYYNTTGGPLRLDAMHTSHLDFIEAPVEMITIPLSEYKQLTQLMKLNK
jgi:hypothetical protein